MGEESRERVQFYSEEIDFELENEEAIIDWILKGIKDEGSSLKRVTYVFCSDEYLYEVNMKYLNHDTYTDIITFPMNYNPIESDIFISIDRIKDNAKELNVSFKDELHRVIIHGVLHLIGYDDKTNEAQLLMTQKENEFLAKRLFL
ncbi:MAG: rRNA maturation RNase YbeY [Saprospiraceae bacterium]